MNESFEMKSLRSNNLTGKYWQAFVAVIDYELAAKEHCVSFIHKGYTIIANRQ